SPPLGLDSCISFHRIARAGTNSVITLPRYGAETPPCLLVSVVKWITYGQAGQRRSLDVHCDRDPGFYRAGHDLQRLGGDGQGTVWVSLRVPAEAIGMGRCGTCRDGRGHEGGLQAPATSGAGFLVSGLYHASAHLGIFSSSRPRHPPLVSRGSDFVAAVGTGQARTHPVSCVVSLKQNQEHG